MTKEYVEMTESEQAQHREQVVVGNTAPPADKETKDLQKVTKDKDYKVS